MEQKKNYTLPIVMMFLLFAMISFVTGLSNPLGVIVKNQFAVANWMSQLGNFANFIAYAVMGIPAGMMLKRIGYKKTALAAVAVGFVGVGIDHFAYIADAHGHAVAGCDHKVADFVDGVKYAGGAYAHLDAVLFKVAGRGGDVAVLDFGKDLVESEFEGFNPVAVEEDLDFAFESA